MKTVQEIVNARNAKLAAKNKPIVSRTGKVIKEVAAQRTYTQPTNVLQDPTVRSVAIGRRT